MTQRPRSVVPFGNLFRDVSIYELLAATHMQGPEPLGHEDIDRPPQQSAGPIAEHAFDGTIHHYNRADRIGDYHAARIRFDRQSEQALTFLRIGRPRDLVSRQLATAESRLGDQSSALGTAVDK